MEKDSKILITGASGLIGSALVRLLRAEGYRSLLMPVHEELDLRQQTKVFAYFEEEDPDYVFHLAARVGGIKENSEYPSEFCHDNTVMHCNIMLAAHSCGVQKLLFPGSACAYPRDAEQPIKESSFLQGMPEPTNLAYALAKQNGIVMAQSYAKQYGMNVVLPMITNTYGIGDRSTHVIPELIKKFKNAKDEVVINASRTIIREFIYADDVASALVFLMNNYDSSDIINVGTGVQTTLLDLSSEIALATGFRGAVTFDVNAVSGAPIKCLDSSKIMSAVAVNGDYAESWKPKVTLSDGINRVIQYDYE